jgi:hypothetical protein
MGLGSGFGIRDPGSGKKPIPDPGSGSRGQKAPDPGSGSATLIKNYIIFAKSYLKMAHLVADCIQVSKEGLKIHKIRVAVL